MSLYLAKIPAHDRRSLNTVKRTVRNLTDGSVAINEVVTNGMRYVYVRQPSETFATRLSSWTFSNLRKRLVSNSTFGRGKFDKLINTSHAR